MTPDSQSPKHAFADAAKRGDVAGMRRALASTPDHMSPIGPAELLQAFNEALRDDRMATAEFLVRETALTETLDERTLETQVRRYNRNLQIPARTRG